MGMPPPVPPPHSKWRTVKQGDREYYHNTEDGTTTWTKPEELMGDEERALIGTKWRQYQSQGKPYWAH